MKKLVILACVALGMSPVALAGKPKSPPPPPPPTVETTCQFLGTWFGIVSPENPVLSGWMVSVTGQNSSHGTNNLEYPTFDPTLGIGLPAVRVSTLRGVWQRTGGRTFTYSFMGMGVAADNSPVWIGRVSGDITLSDDCDTEYITATMEVFDAAVSPFEGAPIMAVPLAPHYGKRFTMP